MRNPPFDLQEINSLLFIIDTLSLNRSKGHREILYLQLGYFVEKPSPFFGVVIHVESSPFRFFGNGQRRITIKPERVSVKRFDFEKPIYTTHPIYSADCFRYNPRVRWSPFRQRFLSVGITKQHGFFDREINFEPKTCKRFICRRYKAASAQTYSILQALDNAVGSVNETLPKGSTF
jgi:hypothetical protein